MDEAVTPEQVEMQGTVSAASAEIGSSLQQTAIYAAELGWAFAELLGRCFMLKVAQSPVLDWSGDKLIRLQEIYTPREKIRALMVEIRFLADSLGVSSCLIEHHNDPDNARPYVDVLGGIIEQITQHGIDEMTLEQLRGKINGLLFFWDLCIHDMLQNRATTIPKAYVVGRSLAGVRWYIGLQDQTPDDEFMKQVCDEYIPLMNPFVSPFATGALSNSLAPWWNAISSGRVDPYASGETPLELQKQANIWYSLLTCEREALSYAPIITERRYIWRVLQVSWPVFLLGLLVFVVVLVLLLFVIISNFNVITKDVAAIVALLTTLGILNSLGKTVGNLLENAVSEVTGTFRGTVIDNISHSTQQEAVNKATFIPPAVDKQNMGQTTQVKGKR
jgi:hypothetical protein